MAVYTFLLLVWSSVCCNSELNDQVERHYVHFSSLSRVKMLFTSKKVSTLRCGTLCTMNERCCGFQFQKEYMLCILLGITSEKSYIYRRIFMQSGNIVQRDTGIDWRETTLSLSTKDASHCSRPHIENARIRETYGVVGQMVEYTCNYRYSRCRSDENNTITCLPGGQWSSPPGLCHSYMWHGIVTGQYNFINFTCPINDGTYIVIEGRTATFTTDTQVQYILYGNGFALAHSFLPGKHMGHLVIQKKTSIWKELRSNNQKFRMKENANFQVKFRVEGSLMRVQLGRKIITRYNVSQGFEINKLSIKADLTNQSVQVKYKVRHSFRWG